MWLLFFYCEFYYFVFYFLNQIVNWPPPYSSSMTPYKERDFNNQVRRACSTTSTAPRISKVIVLGDVAVGKTSLVNR